MTGFEYNVVPAPTRGLKGKGIKGTPARFANAVQTVMNEMGAQGWEYQRTDTLPVEERQGLTGKTTTFQHLLVFRRPLETPLEEVVEVAALIEDQSEVVQEVTPEPEVGDIAAQQSDDALSDDAPSDDAPVNNADNSEAQKSALSLERDDRVSETLKAPFSFPWDRRRVAATAPKDDKQIPGE